jgi:hypothetical protein
MLSRHRCHWTPIVPPYGRRCALGHGFVTRQCQIGNLVGRWCPTYVTLWFVPGNIRADQAADRWRDLFRRADRLQATAPAEEKRKRGRDFEQILHGMLAEAGLAPRIRFRPTGEEIDGSFLHQGRVMLLEAKWTQDPLPASSIYQFRGKVEGKLVGTVGVFISISGFSADAVDALVAGKVINTILFDGDDMRAVVTGQVTFDGALDLKLRAAAESGTPFLPLRDPVSGRPFDISYEEGGLLPTRMVVVEGPFDARLVHALADELGPSTYQLEVLAAGGRFNLAALSNAVLRAGNSERVIIIADGDGNPVAVQHQIDNDLGTLSPEAAGQTEILVFDPTFEEALGVLEGFATGRRRVLELDRNLLRDRVRFANVRQLAESNHQVQALLDALGLGR